MGTEELEKLHSDVFMVYPCLFLRSLSLLVPDTGFSGADKILTAPVPSLEDVFKGHGM